MREQSSIVHAKRGTKGQPGKEVGWPDRRQMMVGHSTDKGKETITVGVSPTILSLELMRVPVLRRLSLSLSLSLSLFEAKGQCRYIHNDIMCSKTKHFHISKT